MKFLDLKKVMILILFCVEIVSVCRAVSPLSNIVKEKSFVPVDSLPGKWVVISIEDAETGETYDTSEELEILPFSVDEKSLKIINMTHAPQSADSVVVQKSDQGDVVNALTYWVSKKEGRCYTDNLQIILGNLVRKPVINLLLSDLSFVPEGLVSKEGKMSFTNSSGEVQEIKGVFTLRRKN